MCKLTGGTPQVQKRDLKAEKLEADREATRGANAEIASRKAKRQRSSLISNVGGSAGLGGSAISINRGKDTLG